MFFFFFFSSRRRHTRSLRDWSSDVCSSDLDVLGWRAIDTEVVGQLCHLLQPDDGQFILLAEGKDPMSSPGYDHLGLLMETREEVDAIRDECQRFAEKDERMRLTLYDDLAGPTVTVH